jgi:IS1 family transposase
MVALWCEKFHNEAVVGVQTKRVQADEIWSFCYAKEKNVTDEMREGSGDVWTWTALDADSKLIVSWYVGDRGAERAHLFMQDVAARLANNVQLTTDGHRAYLDAVYGAFENNIDYAQLVKIYGASTGKAKLSVSIAVQNVPAQSNKRCQANQRKSLYLLLTWSVKT